MKHQLSLNQFIDYIREHLMEGWGQGRQLSIREVTKNNGMTLTGLTVAREGATCAPTFYFEQFYEEYLNGADIDGIIRSLRNYYDEVEEEGLPVPLDIFDYEKIKHQLIFRIVNYEKNKEQLADCPHIRLHDLAIQFRCVAFRSGYGMASLLVNNDLMEGWQIDQNELLLQAEENTRRLFPGEIRPLGSYLCGQGEDCLDDEEMMFIASNEQTMNGATVLLYDGLLEEFAQVIQGNYYILPSSIHELIFIPEEFVVDPVDLHELVRDANETVVAEDEVLSDSVYYYNWKTKSLCVSE